MKDLGERCTALETGNAELKKMVNISNVMAVRSAQASQKAAESKAEKDIFNSRISANKKISEAMDEKNAAIREADRKVAIAQKERQISRTTLFITMLFCAVAYPDFLIDSRDFVSSLIKWCINKIYDYSLWLGHPYHTEFINGIEKAIPYSTGPAWILRVLSLIFVPALVFGTCYGLYRVWLYYKKRWCSLSLRVLLISLAAVILFGEGIHEYVSINLCLLYLLIQIAYLCCLRYLDGCYENRNKTVEWKRIQNM